MFSSFTAPLRGFILLVVLALYTSFCSLLLCLLVVVRVLIPIHGWHIVCSRVANAVAQFWVGCNNLGLKLTKDIKWDIRGNDTLKRGKWHLLVANHQSMVDIVVLQKTFHRITPSLKFFIKKELIWVPIMGPAWWALDFPFMKRTGSTRQDLETARKACDKFKLIPVTIMNFVEGTRFTTAKQKEQNSPFKHLLKPKTGGFAIVLNSMGKQLHSILDVTIVYPEGVPGLWEFLCRKSMKITVRVKEIPVTGELMGDYFSDRAFRQYLNNWLNTLWIEKDRLIETLSPPLPLKR